MRNSLFIRSGTLNLFFDSAAYLKMRVRMSVGRVEMNVALELYKDDYSSERTINSNTNY